MTYRFHEFFVKSSSRNFSWKVFLLDDITWDERVSGIFFFWSPNLSGTLFCKHNHIGIYIAWQRPQKMAAVAIIMAENFSDLDLPFTCFVGCLFPVTWLPNHFVREYWVEPIVCGLVSKFVIIFGFNRTLFEISCLFTKIGYRGHCDFMIWYTLYNTVILKQMRFDIVLQYANWFPQKLSTYLHTYILGIILIKRSSKFDQKRNTN